MNDEFEKKENEELENKESQETEVQETEEMETPVASADDEGMESAAEGLSEEENSTETEGEIENPDDLEVNTFAAEGGDWATAEIAQPVKKSKAGIIAIIAAIVIIIVIGALTIGGYMLLRNRNPYNREYADVTGRTVQDIADNIGMSVEEFLAEYGLPADMPADTNENAAYFTIPASKMAEMNNMDFETMKSLLKLPDDTDPNATWGSIEGELPISERIGGADKFEEFKQEYGLNDKITADTKWKEVRKIVDTATMRQRLEEQKQAEKDAKNKAAPTEAPAAVPTEAPVQAPVDGQQTTPAQ